MTGEKIIQAFVAETGESSYTVAIDVSGHLLKGDEPVAAGGANLGPSPYDLLTASLGECTAMTVRWYAKQKNLPLEKVEVKITHRKEAVEGKPGLTDVFTKEILLYGAGLTAVQREKLLDVAGKCPVHRTLEAVPVITTRLGN